MAKWTFEQEVAIKIRNANLLISAAAGSGKTAVLVERITQLMLNREAEIHRMLIVTYTNAAASEMRGRIEAALSKAIDDHDEDAVYLNDQIKLLNRASIKTFHAFCLDVIRNHFQSIDCDPSFKMLSEPERDIMMRQAVELVLEKHFEGADPEFLSFVEAYSGNRNDEKLVSLIFQVFGFIQSQPNPMRWLESHKAVYGDENHEKRQAWMEILKQSFIEKLEGALDLLEYAIELCASPGGPEAYIKTLESDIKGIQGIIDEATDLATFAKAIEAFKFDKIVTIKKEEKALCDEKIIEEVKEAIRNKAVKAQVFEPIKKFFAYKSIDRFQQELLDLSSKVEVLYRLTEDFSKQFRALKKKKNVLDFNDLEHYAIEILEDDAIAQSFSDKFDYIFVDEYQDSSGIQEHIVQKISKSNNVFMVGDVKQSIYKFRLADPELFIGKYKSFTKLDQFIETDIMKSIEEGVLSGYEDVILAVQKRVDALGENPNLRIDLRRNFRTRGEILNSVNVLFEDIMSEKLGEINYDRDAKLYPGMAFSEAMQPFFEINIISKKSVSSEEGVDESEDGDESADEVLKTEELEATAIASAIKNRIGTMIYDPKTQAYRPCCFKDIVVLIRSSRSWTPAFEQVFMEQGIPLFADSNSGYFDALEIKWVVALMQIIDNPLQDLAVLTILRSPLVQLSIEELAELKAQSEGKEHYYYKCIHFVEQEESEPSLKRKLACFMQLVDRLREKSRYLPLDEWIWTAISETGFYQYASAMPGGISRQANLKLLVERAAQLKGSRVVTLSHFIEFLGKMNATQGDYGVAKVISEEDDVVRLMSIHKSKGLEFPIVIIAGLGRKFNLMDAQGDLMLHKHLGIGLTVVDVNLRTKSKTLPQFVIRDRIKNETLSEEMRVLYVALTRPVDQLILFATVSDYEAKLKKWERKTDALSLTSAVGFIDWIMPSALKNKHISIDVLDAESIGSRALKTEIKENSVLLKWQSILAQASEEHVIDELLSPEDNAIYREIDQRLSYDFKGIEISNKPVKITVSEKKREGLDETSLPKLLELPKFMKEQMPLSSAEIGTAIHTIFERIDIYMSSEDEHVEAYLDVLERANILTEQQRQAISTKVIKRFLNSDLVLRLKSALSYKRETPFVIKMEDQYVQGIIDLYYEDDDGLVLIDYKSDKISHDKANVLKERYGTQIDIYEKALNQLTQRSVKEKYIYLTEDDVLVKF